MPSRTYAVLASAIIVIATLLISTAYILGASRPAEECLRRQRCLVLATNGNTVRLDGQIDDDNVDAVMRELGAKSRILPWGEPIYLYLSSPGGDIDSGMRLIEFMHGMPRPIITVSQFSASMSFIISQYSTKRYALPSAVLMSHRAHIGGISGYLPGSLITRVLFHLTFINTIEEHIAKRAGITLKEYQEATKNELWLSGEQAKKLHFVDKLVDIRCDSTLSGFSSRKTTLRVGPFPVEVQFPSCPLMAIPKINTPGENAINSVTKYLSNEYIY